MSRRFDHCFVKGCYEDLWDTSKSAKCKAHYLERIEKQIDKSGDCWVFTGHVGPHGYGYVGPRRAHRLVYELHVGPIPDGLTLDHICHTRECRGGPTCPHRRCVNPDHLKPATQQENYHRTVPTGAKHGTCHMYKKYGCRCAPCVDAYLSYHRAWRARQKAAR